VSARANGEGGVYQRKDGRWCAAAHVPVAGGGTRRVFAYGQTRQDANRKLRDLLDRADKHIPAPRPG
jgi:integrase